MKIFKGFLLAVLAMLVGVGANPAIGQTPPPDGDAPGQTVLTRGPVHEAFAGVVTFNPEPGVVVAKAPPAVIEEMPPEEKPQGDNVTWIPGYWAWDDERNDYLWVSGTWRALPPGRAWMAGYWGKTPQGYQWTSGYWADATVKETTYLPAPPATVEVGPNIDAPSDDYGWSPGCWVWYHGRYAWQPGYWVQGRADWDWCPGHYVWTPRGYIFVGGFWDYPVERRGILFAPVYFESGVYSRRGFFYSPTIVIGLDVFSDHLFLRPRYCHYYFGDYYAPSYYQGGFYASFSFQSSHYGYDPIFSHQRWEHRQDREWEHRAAASYEHRRDNEAARPPRTWAAERKMNPGSAESKQNHMVMAAPIDQLAKQKGGSMQFQPVAKAERQKLAERGEEVQRSRDQRRTLEAKSGNATVAKPGTVFAPATVKLPRSPIVSKPVSQLGRDQAPPRIQQSPKADFNPASSGTKSQPLNQAPNLNRNNPQLNPRPLNPDKQPGSGPIEPTSRYQNTIPAPGPSQVEKPAAAVQEPAAPAPRNRELPSEGSKSVTPAPDFKPATRAEANHPPVIQEPTPPKADRRAVERPSRPVESNPQPQPQPQPRDNPNAGDNNGARQDGQDKDRGNRRKE